MRPFLHLLIVLLVTGAALEAATVVTLKERLAGTIIAQDDKSLTLRLENRLEIKIARDQVLQIFDDKGDLVWQAALPPEEKRTERTEAAKPTGFARHSIIIDLYAGGATGGIYSDENRFVSDARIYSTYNDGSTQYAKSSMFGLGGGLSYQKFESDRWSTLISYLYRSTSQEVSIGDDKKYEKNTLADTTITRRHAIFYGKEVHFYPSGDGSSIDLIGQIGYELGSYSPLRSYSQYRTQLSPIPAAYTGTESLLIHGPSARIGAGMTLRGEHWQLRLTGFYQLTSLFLAEKTVLTSTTSSVVHDYYIALSLGYGW